MNSPEEKQHRLERLQRELPSESPDASEQVVPLRQKFQMILGRRKPVSEAQLVRQNTLLKRVQLQEVRDYLEPEHLALLEEMERVHAEHGAKDANGNLFYGFLYTIVSDGRLEWTLSEIIHPGQHVRAG